MVGAVTAPVVWQNRIVAYHPAYPLDQLTPHPRNPKIHPRAQTEAVKGIISEVGWVLPLLQNIITGYTLDGHNRMTGAGEAQQTTAPVIDIAVSPAEELYILSTLDPVGALAATDSTLLADLLADVSTGDAAVQRLLDGLAATIPPVVPLPMAGGDEFPVEPSEGATVCQPGDVWRVGDHLLACLDSTDAAAVERAVGALVPTFVWSDPPYGIEIVQNGQIGAPNLAPTGRYAPVIGDDSPQTVTDAFTLHYSRYPNVRHIWWGANHYANALPASPCWIVWDKRGDMAGNNFADAELAWCNDKSAVRVYRQVWSGMIREGEHGKRVHPTQKPVALAQWAFGKYGKASDVIIDPFLGSGISLIAAHRLGDQRRVIGFELAPAYIDVCIKRAEAEGIGPIARVGDG